MELETASPHEEQPPGGPTRRFWWLALLSVAAALIAGVAYVQAQNDGSSAASGSTTIPLLSDLAGAAPGSGEVAPDFELPTLDGGSFSLADHQATDGRPVFLNLWASWCFPCRAEMPGIDTASRKHPEVLFVGVAVADDNDAAAKFAREIGVKYTIAFDRDDQVADGYPVLGMPGTFLIASDGSIVKTIFGAVDEEDIAELLSEWFGV
jgi:thiol-disulfide isomerase/thioredoxin